MDLRSRFVALFQRAGGIRDDAFICYHKLFERIEKSHRAYYTLDYVERYLKEFDTISNFPADDMDNFEFAIWYLRSVYDSRRRDNEEKSIELFYQDLVKYHLSKISQVMVRDFILAVKHLQRYPDIRGYMVDIDLFLFLGQDDDVFDEYEKKLMEEYHWMNYETYFYEFICKFESLLARPLIYSVPDYRSKYEVKTRENILNLVQKKKRD